MYKLLRLTIHKLSLLVSDFMLSIINYQVGPRTAATSLISQVTRRYNSRPNHDIQNEFSKAKEISFNYVCDFDSASWIR